jgi:hypothetical protein
MLKMILLAGTTWLAVSFPFCLLVARMLRADGDSDTEYSGRGDWI